MKESKGVYSVYCFTNKINCKKYVGITSNIKRRYNQHKSARNRCPVFSSAIKKYGFESFDFVVLQENLNQQNAKLFEKSLIKEFNSMVPNGYNRTEGGDSSVIHTEETKVKISLKNKLYILKNGHSRTGKKHTEETKKILSELAFKRKNRPYGENHWNCGCKASELTKQKMRINNSLGNNPFAKKIIDLDTNIIYSCINEAKTIYNISHSLISMICSGKRKSSKYNFMYLKDYEEKGNIPINR